MDEDDLDLNQDWFSDSADQQAGQIQNGGRGEYSTLNVPIDDDYPRMLQPPSAVYQQQRVVYQQQIETYEESQQRAPQNSQPRPMRMQQSQWRQNPPQQPNSGAYVNYQQPQYPIRRPQAPTQSWDIGSQQSSNSQIPRYHQMTANQREYYPDQSGNYNDMSQSSTEQSYGQMQPINSQNRAVYKQPVGYTQTSPPNVQYSDHFMPNQRHGYNQSYQPSNQQIHQRISGSGIQSSIDHKQAEILPESQIEPIDSFSSYNITPLTTASRKLPPQRSQFAPSQSAQTSNQIQGKVEPAETHIIIQGQPQMQDQYMLNEASRQNRPSSSRPRPRKPVKKAPTIEEITKKFEQMATLRFETQQQSSEFMSILVELQRSPDDEARIKISERIENLMREADISQKPTTSMQPIIDTKPKAPSRSRKKTSQEPFSSDYSPNCSSNMYSAGGQPITYTQSKPYAINADQAEMSSTDQPAKKPPRRRPPRKPQQADSDGTSGVVQTNQLGQQILICTQPGASNIQPTPVMISYETLYPGGANGQQIYVHVGPMPVTTSQQSQFEAPKEIASKIEQAREIRQKKVAKFFDDLHEKLDKTDYITPFKDMADIVDRLIPFAFNYEPDYTEEYLEKVDHEIIRRFVYLDNRLNQINNKMEKIYIKEAIDDRKHDFELNMLLYLDNEYERRRFEQDKIYAKSDLDNFLRDSEIIRAGVDLAEIEVKRRQLKPLKSRINSPSFTYGTYEYHDFNENICTPTQATSPPPSSNLKIKIKRKREKSKYVYASDLDDTDSDEEDEEEKMSENGPSKAYKSSSVTELIDLSEIDNIIDTEAGALSAVPTPDAETRAANEQTEAIDKALELLPHDLENVTPLLFENVADPKDMQFNLPISFQPTFQSNVSSSASTSAQSMHQQSPAIQMMPIMPILPPHSSTMQSPFGDSFGVMKTPPAQQRIPQPIYPSMPSFSQHPQLQPSVLSPPKPSISLPHQIRQQPPMNIMKPPHISMPTTNNNITQEKFDTSQLASNIPQFKPINTIQTPLLNQPFGSMLKPPTSMDLTPKMMPPNQLPHERHSFDASQSIHGHDFTIRSQQTSLKQHPRKPENVPRNLIHKSQQNLIGAMQVKQPEVLLNQQDLAAVSKNERDRLINAMNKKLKDEKSQLVHPDRVSENVPIKQPIFSAMPGSSLSTHTLDKRSQKFTSGMKDHKSWSKHQKIDQPLQLNVAPSHTFAICQPSPTITTSMPIRLRFKMQHNQNSSNGDAMQSKENLNDIKPSPASFSDQQKLEMERRSNTAQLLSDAELREKELKRQRKAEKKLRKEQKHLEKQRRKAEEANKEEGPVKLVLKLPPKPFNEQPSSEPKVEKLKLSIRPIQLETSTEKHKKHKKSKKRHRSSTPEAPPILVAQQEMSQPKIPRLKIKFKGQEDDHNPSTSKHKSSMKLMPTKQFEIPRKTSTLSVNASPMQTPKIGEMSFNFKPNTPVSAPIFNPSIPLVTPKLSNVTNPDISAPQFSDDEIDDPVGEMLREQTSKLASSLTKL